MKNKFILDTNNFPTDFARVAYIEGRTKGIASKHLRSRVRDEIRDPLITVDEIFNFLTGIFRDYNL